MMKMSKKALVPALLIGIMMIGTVFGAFLSYKAFVEIYGKKYPLGIVELETWGMKDIEGLEAGEQDIGEIRVWTYSPNAELILQLMQLERIVTNFRSFTVKVCLPLDIVYVVDITGSMGLYMDAVKEKLIELTQVLMIMNECPVQVAVVGFKDFPGETIWQDFVTLDSEANYKKVVDYINSLTAFSGVGIPQSHYLGFEKAKELFDAKEGSWKNAREVVFVSDAESGFADKAEFDHAEAAVRALEAEGIPIHSVLCGPEQEPQYSQLKWYAEFTNGHFILGPERIVPGVTRDPTWIVKLTPITPFDSFRMKLNSSAPTMKEDYYSFHIFVDYFCKAVPWHESFVCELAANLEHAEIPPSVPPPPAPPPTPPGVGIALTIDPSKIYPPDDSKIDWTITAGGTTAVKVTFTLYKPDGTIAKQIIDDSLPIELTGTWTHSFTAADPKGYWNMLVIYQYDSTTPGQAMAGGTINVDP